MCWSFTALSTEITAGGAVSFLTPNTFFTLSGAPRCDQCGGAVKPDVVLYEEALDQAVLSKVAGASPSGSSYCGRHISHSLSGCRPAALFQGSRLAVVNQTALPWIRRQTCSFRGKSARSFPSSDSAFYSHWAAFLPARRFRRRFF